MTLPTTTTASATLAPSAEDWASATFDFPTSPTSRASRRGSRTMSRGLLSPEASPGPRPSLERFAGPSPIITATGQVRRSISADDRPANGLGLSLGAAHIGGTGANSMSRRGSTASTSHARLPSLTSACPPVTASWAAPAPSPLRVDTLPLASTSVSSAYAGFGLTSPETASATISRPPSRDSRRSGPAGALSPSHVPLSLITNPDLLGAVSPPAVATSTATSVVAKSPSPVLGEANVFDGGAARRNPPGWKGGFGWGLSTEPATGGSTAGTPGPSPVDEKASAGFAPGFNKERSGHLRPQRARRAHLRSLVTVPIGALHSLLGPLGFLVLARPSDGSSSQPASPYGSSSNHPAPSPLVASARKPLRYPSSGVNPPLVIRLLGVAYVCVAAVVFGRSCARWIDISRTGVDPAKVRRDEPVRQVVFGGAWVAEWEERARQKLGGWMHQHGAGASIEEDAGVDVQSWDMEGAVSRKWGDGALTATTNPLTSFSHPYRLSKMHGKLPPTFADAVEPFLFPAQGGHLALGKGEVTACVYTNDFWASEVSELVKKWGGPVSLIWETTAERHPATEEEKRARQDVLARIAKLRETDPYFRALVDVHLVSSPPVLLEPIAARKKERLLVQPTATNQQLNIARFFAKTPIVWLVPDARMIPSHNLRVKLNGESYKRQVLRHGDALVVPTFGFLRPDLQLQGPALPSSAELRSAAAVSVAGDATARTNGTTWDALAKAYVGAHRKSIHLAPESWPKTKRSLVGLVTRSEGGGSAASATLAMHEDSWDAGRGPTNWALWRKPANDPRLAEAPDAGGGAGLGVGGTVGGGSALYRVTAYDLHYAPSVVVAKQGQPWCTERFEDNKAACAYQMYLAGAEMWVVPEEWAFTLEFIGNGGVTMPQGEADKLKSAISSRLYTKFHQEACMHYGREFLSNDAWEDDRARHLRAMCSKVLASWGVGVGKE